MNSDRDEGRRAAEARRAGSARRDEGVTTDVALLREVGQPYVSVAERRRSGRARAGEAPEEGPPISPVVDRRPQDRQLRSGARPGATTSNATAITRIGCRAAAPTCATARSSICRSCRAGHGAGQRVDDLRCHRADRHRRRSRAGSRSARTARAGSTRSSSSCRDASRKGVMARLCRQETRAVPVAEGHPLHVQLSGLGVDVQARGGGAVRRSARDWTSSRSCCSRCAHPEGPSVRHRSFTCP